MTRRPPLVPGLPLLGVGHKLLGDPESQLRKWHKRYGPIFQFQAAHFNYVCMAGPDANEFVNGDGKAYFSAREFWSSFAREIGSPNTITALDGEPHRQLRSELKPAFSRSVVESGIGEVLDLTRASLAGYRPGDELPMVQIGQKLASNIVGTLMMDTIPTDEELESLFEYASTLTVWLSVLRLPRAILWLKGPRFRRARQVTNDLMDRVFAQALTGKSGRKLLLQTFREAQAKFPELVTDGDVRSVGFLSFFAGIDTLGQTITFMLWELLRNPDTLARIQAEVDQVFGQHDGCPLADAIRTDMPLCRAAFMETLRLHPTGFGIVRSAACAFEFAGCRVDKGQDIVVYTTVCHRMAEYFPDPERFDIDRYMEPRFEERQRGVYAPFGRGPHKCLGAGWAELQAILMLAGILYHYDLALPDKMVNAMKIMRTTPTLGNDFRLHLAGRRR